MKNNLEKALQKAKELLPHKDYAVLVSAVSAEKDIDKYQEDMVECQLLLKADENKQIIYSVVLDPYTFGDSQGDWVPPNEIENAAHRWLAESRVIGFQHEFALKPEDAAVVESWIVQYPSHDDYRKAITNEKHSAYKMPFGNQQIHSGAWVMGVKLGDRAWELVQSGHITGYSIGGSGTRLPISESMLPEVTFIDLIENQNDDNKSEESKR